jgi:cellulose synthase/poly-beta-1,6-N-acetylglucosamine synthase-like glycosyltransferase
MQQVQEPRILVVSPVRNEAAHIDAVAHAIAAQELAPARWIVIDDDSSDGTLELLHELENEIDCLTVLQAPRYAPKDAGENPRDRLAHAIEVRNFNLVLTQAGSDDYTHVMKLDGDIELPPHYLRVLMERFAQDPSLGLAGGVLVEPTADGGVRKIKIPANHIHGALKCYSEACRSASDGTRSTRPTRVCGAFGRGALPTWCPSTTGRSRAPTARCVGMRGTASAHTSRTTVSYG